jgi:type II secretory pathway pseudopilin PulG
MKKVWVRRICPRARKNERGYILLVLLLFFALMIIATAIIVPTITFEIRRDKEAEMIHRGVQYARAIRAFTRATSRYPLRLEELQSTNGRRFIRKLYKDPITGQDFRLLHPPDIRSAPAPNLNQSGDPANANSADGSASGSDSPDPGNQDAAAPPPSKPSGTFGAQNPSQGSSGSDAPLNGGIIVGVASKSKARSIREFDGKNHYKDWLFFYDPSNERGLRANGPTSTILRSLQPLNGNGFSGANQQQQSQAPPTNQPSTPQ